MNSLINQPWNDIFHQEAFAKINRDGSKLRTYAKIKQEHGILNYLNTITNVERLIHLCKIRSSNHELMIEKGTHQGLEINQRNCPFCEAGKSRVLRSSSPHRVPRFPSSPLSENSVDLQGSSSPLSENSVDWQSLLGTRVLRCRRTRSIYKARVLR